MKITVKRYDPSKDNAPYETTYEVPHEMCIRDRKSRAVCWQAMMKALSPRTRSPIIRFLLSRTQASKKSCRACVRSVSYTHLSTTAS